MSQLRVPVAVFLVRVVVCRFGVDATKCNKPAFREGVRNGD